MNVRWTAICLALAMMLTIPAAADAQEITLSAAIDRALEHNARLQSRREAVGVQALETEVARGQRWPEIGLSAQVQHHSDPVLLGPLHEVGDFPPLDDDVAAAAVSLRQPLYAGGRLVAGEALARQQHAGAQSALRGGEQDLVYNVVATYAEVLQLRQVVSSLAHRIRSLESEAALIAKKVEAGRAAPLEQVRVETQLSQARHEQAVQRQRMDDTRSLLASLLGTREELAPLAGLEQIELDLPPSVEQAAADAQQNMPAVREAEARRSAAAAEVTIARAARRPRLHLLTEVERSLGLSEGGREENWRVGLVLELPLFDGGVRRNRVAQARLNHEIGTLRLEAVRDEVSAEVRRAFGGLETARSRVTVAGQSVDEAEEALRIETLRYRQGASTVTDLLSAEAAHWEALTRLLRARYDVITAQVRLLRAVGRLDGETIKAAAREQQRAEAASINPAGDPAVPIAAADRRPRQENGR